MEEEQERKEGKDNKERSRGNWQRGRIVGDDDKQGKIGGKEGKVQRRKTGTIKRERDEENVGKVKIQAKKRREKEKNVKKGRNAWKSRGNEAADEEISFQNMTQD